MRKEGRAGAGEARCLRRRGGGRRLPTLSLIQHLPCRSSSHVTSFHPKPTGEFTHLKCSETERVSDAQGCPDNQWGASMGTQICPNQRPGAGCPRRAPVQPMQGQATGKGAEEPFLQGAGEGGDAGSRRPEALQEDSARIPSLPFCTPFPRASLSWRKGCPGPRVRRGSRRQQGGGRRGSRRQQGELTPPSGWLRLYRSVLSAGRWDPAASEGPGCPGTG